MTMTTTVAILAAGVVPSLAVVAIEWVRMRRLGLGAADRPGLVPGTIWALVGLGWAGAVCAALALTGTL